MAGLGQRLSDLWARLMERGDADGAVPPAAEAAVAQAPVIWMLGKVQSGKSSIVKAVTGASAAEIGSGFKPCTRTAAVFDFPGEAPLVRFLDTRGLGEAGYDAAADIDVAMAHAHLLLVVMRAMDHAQDEIVRVVREARQRHPGWPVLVAQTCLHDAYRSGMGHVVPYPFSEHIANDARVPEALCRSLVLQRRMLDGVGGSGPTEYVPIDFTLPEDGFEPRFYGLDALLDGIGRVAPAGIAATVRELRWAASDRTARIAHPRILGYAAAAAAVDVVPVAGVVAVPGVQAQLLRVMAGIYGVAWDRQTLTTFASCLGAGVLARLIATFGIREAAKLIPVYGQTAGAAAAAVASFSTTYALGKAAGYFLERRRRGEASDPAGVADTYKQALAAALALARERGVGKPDAENSAAGKGRSDAR